MFNNQETHGSRTGPNRGGGFKIAGIRGRQRPGGKVRIVKIRKALNDFPGGGKKEENPRRRIISEKAMELNRLPMA